MKKRIIIILLTVCLLAGALSVSALAASHPFTDVNEKAYYAPSVAYVYTNGLMVGTTETTFSPNTKMDRAMLVTVLYRMDGQKPVSASTPFTDIKTTAYYYPALQWAYKNGIIFGTTSTTFSPTQSITREMMVTIFHRYAQYKGLDVSKLDSLSAFKDTGSISNYAKTPFAWAVAASIIYGETSTTLAPKGNATRAQCAAILQRFANWSASVTPAEPAPTEPEPTKPEETEPVHTHSYTSEVTKEATCTGEGIKTYTCSCGDSYTEKIPATGHSYTSKVTKEATCTEGGIKTYTCSVCGDSYTEVIPAVGHDWETVHHEEVGHWIGGIKCWCGWTVTELTTQSTKDENGIYQFDIDFMDHISGFDTEEKFTEHGSYQNITIWVVDTPAYDEWICPVCGEVSDVKP